MRFKRKDFKKSDLKPGMVVLRKDKHLCIVNDKGTRLIRKNGFLNLYHYNETLDITESYNDFLIIAVYMTSQKIKILLEENGLYNDIDKSLLTLIWER